MKKLFAFLLVLCMASLASATTIWLTDEGRAVHQTSGSTIRLTISSDASTSLGLISMNAIVTVMGGDVFIAAMNTSDCAAYGWDPTFSADPLGLGTSTVEIYAGSVDFANGNLEAIIGYVDLAYTGGTQVVSISPGMTFGGSWLIDGSRPVFSTGVVEIPITVPDPNLGTCWDALECGGQPYGDATCDGRVNFADLIEIKHSWLRSKGGGYNCCADFNHDGVIDFRDLIILKLGWFTSGYTPSTGNQNCPP